MPDRDLLVLRYADFELDETQIELRNTLRNALTKHCSPSRVRAASTTGFDPELWQLLVEMRIVAMALGPEHGGDGAGFVEMALVAEELGRSLAPVPALETIVTERALARLGRSNGLLDNLSAEENRIATLAVAGEGLVPAGSVADAVLVRTDSTVQLLTGGDHPRRPNIGDLPLAAWSPTAPGVKASARVEDPSRIFDAAVTEWRLLVAAALVGLADAALVEAVRYATDRVAFGQPIGSFQAVSHPLADVHVAVTGARHLVHMAAWHVDHEPDRCAELVPMALLAAGEAAAASTRVGIHVQGGFGFTVESDMQLYFRRAKALTTLSGDPERLLAELADARYGHGGDR